MKTTQYYPLSGNAKWILWKLEEVNGRMSKVPYSAKYNGKASTTDSSSWADFQTALALLHNTTKFEGIGFVFSAADGLVFIDIDHCIENGVISETGRDIISHFKSSYIELSQSGTGIHIITKGIIPKALKNSQEGIEMYCNARYCAITGKALSPTEPHEEQSAVDYVYERYRKKEPVAKVIHRTIVPTLEETEIIRKASRDPKFSALYNGAWEQHFSSQSEADLSLCNYLAFWCECDTALMDSIFKTSGLYRDKWDRPDYKARTLDTAVLNCQETYSEYVLRRKKEEHDELFKQYCQN